MITSSSLAASCVLRYPHQLADVQAAILGQATAWPLLPCHPAAISWHPVSWAWQKQCSGDARSGLCLVTVLVLAETCWGARHYGAPAVAHVGARCDFPLRSSVLCLLESTERTDGQQTTWPHSAYGLINSNKLRKLNLVTWKRNCKSLNLFPPFLPCTLFIYLF